MIQKFKQIADDIANSRVRLAHPLLGKQDRKDILDEVKRMECIEKDLRKNISELQDKLNNILSDKD